MYNNYSTLQRKSAGHAGVYRYPEHLSAGYAHRPVSTALKATLKTSCTASSGW